MSYEQPGVYGVQLFFFSIEIVRLVGHKNEMSCQKNLLHIYIAYTSFLHFIESHDICLPVKLKFQSSVFTIL